MCYQHDYGYDYPNYYWGRATRRLKELIDKEREQLKQEREQSFREALFAGKVFKHVNMDVKSPTTERLVAQLVPCDPPTIGQWYSPFKRKEQGPHLLRHIPSGTQTYCGGPGLCRYCDGN